jgi:tRNA pseudouridine55 synthase
VKTDDTTPNTAAPSHQGRRSRQRVDGVLLLDKPVGPSSSRILGHVKHLFNAAKAGHAGTLDPLASGLLPLMFGEATKYAAEGLDADKTYEAQVLLGTKTSTADAEGQVIARAPVPDITGAAVAVILKSFLGPQQQVPPMYSALKKDGRALYAYAREGKEVDRPARAIHIHALDLLAFDSPVLTIRVVCSKGTYIRTLAEDIGVALGSVAHLKSLRRTGVGNLHSQDVISLQTIEQAAQEQRADFLKPVDWLIRDWPHKVLDAAQASRFLHGQSVMVSADSAPGLIRIKSEQNEFLGTGRVDANAMLHPERVRVISH